MAIIVNLDVMMAKITAMLHPLHEGDHIYLQEWPKMDDKKACRIEAVTLTEQFS